MEKYDLEPVIEAINEVYNNIWLGDLKTAKKVAQTSLRKMQSLADLSELKKTAIELRRIIYKKRKDAREKGIKHRRLWVADRLFEELAKEEIEPIKNIYGVLAIHLSHLKEAVIYLTEAQSQRTIEGLVEKDLEKERDFQRSERYRYAIQRLPDRWEVRAILDTPADVWDLRKLRHRLANYDMSIEEVSRRAFSNIFEIYSRDMYIQIVGQGKLAEISVHTLTTEDAKERVSEIVETIIGSLTM